MVCHPLYSSKKSPLAWEKAEDVSLSLSLSHAHIVEVPRDQHPSSTQ